MNILNKSLGQILYGIAKLISVTLDGFIIMTETIVNLVKSIAKGLLALIGMGGFLLLFLFSGPFGILIFFNPIVLLTILFFIIFPILGTKFISYLKYMKYSFTEYLYDLSKYLIYGKKKRFKSFYEYGRKYRKMEEEKTRQEQEYRRAEQQRQWEERFKQWYEYQNFQRGNTGYHSPGGDNPYVNPASQFKKEYEKSCDLLELPYTADKYEVKLAYRKKAKQYHPDLNKSPDATRMFQEINNAYEFLSDGNIQRYKNIS